jgi:hypothetical protein
MIPDDSVLGRDVIARRLEADLVGPRQADEELSSRPTDIYLTGVLWPFSFGSDGADDERLGTAGASEGPEGGDPEADVVPASSVQKPAVMGISFALAGAGAEIPVSIRFARYKLHSDEGGKLWKRSPVSILSLPVDCRAGQREIDLGQHDAEALGAVLHIRVLDTGEGRIGTVSLINRSDAGESRDEAEQRTFFQTQLQISSTSDLSLVPRPSRDAADGLDRDEASNDLLFKDVFEFASGHTCSAMWSEPARRPDAIPSVDFVATTWLPTQVVKDVSSRGHAVFRRLADRGINLEACALARATGPELRDTLSQFVEAYSDWITGQDGRIADLAERYQAAARDNLADCRTVRDRMLDAIDALEDPQTRKAFQLANHAMDIQFAWSAGPSGPRLLWRPFQLGFLLLSMCSTVDETHADRLTLDLLWFPTGGGKTEAYLALIAFAAFHSRLSDRSRRNEGVVAVMRYTLRLLTTQQFARASAMLLACEAIRTGRVSSPVEFDDLGTRPFSIGLWVGGEATPNSRSISYQALQGAKEYPSPAQIANCPACEHKIAWRQDEPSHSVTAECMTPDCVVHGTLPIWTVDEDIYVERPSLLLGTVDKFAQIVRRPEVNHLFSIQAGTPPTLIIQDELHLISGPLGTLAGLYETALDLMFSRKGIPPKVIGSTATIRRATEQVRDLFDRSACQFPPPALDHRDSGFAVLDETSDGRRYLGVTTAGRSAKFTLQAVAASLLQSIVALPNEEEANNYSTLLAYFNSLRELGGALVLMQDDVTDSIDLFAAQRDEDARQVSNVEELTSRRTQEEIVQMLSSLEIPKGSAGSLDVVLATNMVSVGVDISRLGVMLINGQPKTIAEYIQSTSRVGRGDVRGLVVSILNHAKARDRSHFETFFGWHQRLYRDVEATSVTPFASRARDRALHAALVAAIRHLVPGMLDRPDLAHGPEDRIEAIVDLILQRAARVDPEEVGLKGELERRIEKWRASPARRYWDDFRPRQALLQSAERVAKLRALGRQPGEAWPTMNSMRNVEASSPFRLASRLKRESSGGE